MTLRRLVMLGVMLPLLGAGFGLGQLRESGTPGVFYDYKGRKVDARGRVLNEKGNPIIRTRIEGEFDVSGRILALAVKGADCFVLDRGGGPWSISCVKND